MALTISTKSAGSSWIPLFEEFVRDIRIQSKEYTSPEGGGAPFELWESQKRFLREVGEGLDQGQKYFYCLKSRQLGCSTIAQAICIFWLAMHPGMVMAIVVEKEANARKIRTEIEQILKTLPEGYFADDDGNDFYVTKSNVKETHFSNGSRFDFKVAGTKDRGTAWGEGAGYAAAWLTEVASYGSREGLQSFEEAFAQSNPHSLFLYESTAKGIANVWHDKWKEGLIDPITKRSFFIGWWSSAVNRIPQSDARFQIYGLEKPTEEEQELIDLVRSDYKWKIEPEQLAWYRWREDTNTAGDIMVQNQPWTAKQAFVETGQSFFPNRMVSADMQVIADNPDDYGYLAYRYIYGTTFFDLKCELMEDDADPHDIELRVWEEPVDGAKYVIGVDPAYGRNDHKDWIAIQVYRCYSDKLVQVAEYATYQVDVRYAGWALAHLAGAYKDVMINMELEGGGRVIMNDWANLRQMLNAEITKGNQRGETWEDAIGMARWYIYNRVDSMTGGGGAYNFVTTWKTKQEVMYALRSAYLTRELLVRSMPLLREFVNIRQEGSDIGAPESRDPNMKDDRTFATGFALRAWNNWVRPDMIALNLTFRQINDEEQGKSTRDARVLNNLVLQFFRQQEEDQIVEAPSWRVDQGFE